MRRGKLKHTEVDGRRPGAKPTLKQLVPHLEALSESHRSVLAHALHDEVGGWLVSAIMDLAWVEKHTAASSDENRRRLRRAGESLSNALDKERRVIEDLRPSLLDDVGLFAALRWHMRTACKSAGISCEIDFPDPEPLFLEHARIVLFRIVAEALESLLVDQSVTAANLKITAKDRVLTVSVTSDGVSAPKRNADMGAPYAFLRLQLRAATLRGEIRVIGPSDQGTRIAARFSFENSLQ
jgi:signal transduction histidine kinase